MIIGEKIRKLRNLRGYNEEYLAKKLGMSQNNYSKIELGKVKITLDRIEEIAQVLEIDPIKLIEFDDTLVFNNNNQSGGNSANVINQSLSKKLIEFYENRILHLENEIESFKNLIEEMRKEQK